MEGIDFLYMRVHAMPCVNRCRHCWLFGSPEGGFMKQDSIYHIMEKAAEFKEDTDMDVFPQFFQEPSLHPDFIEIMGRQWELGLTIGDSTWVSTNGHGIARMTDEEINRLAETGVEGVRFTVYGFGDAHDEYAGRKGAWDDIVKAACSCSEHGIEWLAGILMTTSAVDDYHRIRDSIESWGTPCAPAGGWFVPQWNGRARNDPGRVTFNDIEHLLKEAPPIWKSESQHIEDVLSSDELSSRIAAYGRCNIAHLDVYEDLSVHYGGGCDSTPFRVAGEELLLGNLADDGFAAMVHRFVNSPPNIVRALSETTWGDLAQRYGDRSNQQVFYLPDLVVSKWGSQYLSDTLA